MLVRFNLRIGRLRSNRIRNRIGRYDSNSNRISNRIGHNYIYYKASSTLAIIVAVLVAEIGDYSRRNGDYVAENGDYFRRL